MPTGLEIAAAWERTDEGAPEERACFGLFTVACNGLFLTEGEDYFVNRIRNGPLVSTYYAAEWFAWNWWRLRWEPRSLSPDWAFAHRMTAIGEGYTWPNLTIFSDGVRTALIAKPSSRADAKPFRYISDLAAVVPSTTFEGAVDTFLNQILSQLRLEGVGETNLDRIWHDVMVERGNLETAKRRELEALLGREPDEADETTIENLVADAKILGEQAVGEVAADHGRGGDLFDAEALRGIARSSGFAASPRNSVELKPGTALRCGADIPAWRVGAQAAKAVREQERLGTAPINNGQLAQLAGTRTEALAHHFGTPSMSFALDEGPTESRIVLRSRWETGRRFELARLIGDRILGPKDGRLYPATRAYTYRQKMQRSFAAELLSPFDAVDEMLAGDYSIENQQDVAVHYNVSPITISTLLVNHHRLEREDLEEIEAAAI